MLRIGVVFLGRLKIPVIGLSSRNRTIIDLNEKEIFDEGALSKFIIIRIP